MIFDCFPFFNELELLELRLHELEDVVDYFVLVEATKTHSGLDKPLYYDANAKMFRHFWYKIIHVVVENMPITNSEIQAALTPTDMKWIESKYQVEDNWVRERFQRNAIMRALKDCDPDDIIIIEDADEMVRPGIIARLPETICDGSNAVEQTLHTYYMNWKCTNMPWWGSKILKRKFVDNPSEHRFHTPASNYIYNGGWHFGFIGGASKVQEKLKAYAHQEFNKPDVLNNVAHLLAHKKDALGRLYEYQVVPIDETYPKYLRDNQEKFSQFMWGV